MNALSRAIYRRIYRQCQEIDKCVSKRAMLEGHQVGYPVGDDKTNATRRIIERFWNLNGQSELWVPNTEKSIREVTPSLRESWREGGHLEDAMATMKILRDLVIEPQALPRLPYEPDIKSKQVFQVPHFDLKKPGEPAHILLAHPLLPETVTYEGGPVGIDQTLWVHRNTDASIIPGTEYAGGGMYQGGSHGQIMDGLVDGTLDRNDFFSIKSVAAWSYGQLQAEVSEGFWIVAECPDISKTLDHDITGEDFTTQFWQHMLINMEDESGSIPQLSRIYDNCRKRLSG